jgi:nucleoside-diphosphate-sugar epimerase
MDPTLAREDLGFEAQCSLKEGVRRYVETMRRLDLQPTAAD